jgi:hypothetical protein
LSYVIRLALINSPAYRSQLHTFVQRFKNFRRLTPVTGSLQYLVA